MALYVHYLTVHENLKREELWFLSCVETRGSARLGHSSKVNSCSVVELRSRSRVLCPQSLPLAMRIHTKDVPIAFYSLKRMGLAWCNCFPWLTPVEPSRPSVCWGQPTICPDLLCPGHYCVPVTTLSWPLLASPALFLLGSRLLSSSPSLILPNWPNFRPPS